MPTRHGPRRTVFSAVTIVAIFGAQPAAAATVSYQGMCGRTVEVEQWTPQKGAIARFVADAFANSSHTGLWIGLGRVGTSFWSAEGGDPNDACDDCRSLNLVETRADGTRRLHTVLGSTDYARSGSDAAARKEIVLAKLWKLASSTWPADKLTQNYSITVGKPLANAPDEDPPFTVKVHAQGAFEFRYDLGASTSMCWCLYEWKATK